GLGDAAIAVPHQRVGRMEQIAGKPGRRSELTHEQEQRDDREVVDREPRPEQALEIVEQRALAHQPPIAAGASNEHCGAERHAQRDQDQHRADDDAGNLDLAHSAVCSATGSATLIPQLWASATSAAANTPGRRPTRPSQIENPTTMLVSPLWRISMLPTAARHPTARNMIAISRLPKRSSQSRTRSLARSVNRSTAMCP